MKILPLVHISPETAYLVDSYPYGFRLRCKIRYWLETNKKGTRFCSQTTNPKRGDSWNKPKYSTYADISGAMYLDEKEYVQWDALTGYSETKQRREFLDKYGINATDYKRLVYITTLSENFDAAKVRLGNPEYGTPRYQQAYNEAIQATPKA